MSIEALKERLPDYAKDLRLNLSSLASDITLNEQQLAGTFVATAIASRNEELTQAIIAEFGAKLSPEALNAAKAAAAIMGMNNIYYRFTHMMGGDYTQMPAKLRMSVIARPGVDKVDFELWSLAVSAINGCEMCVKSHEQAVREGGLTSEQVQTSVRIAATVHGVAVALQAEPAA
ncbi:MAG: carboxymuconolactone decarboxylase family protein [Acetobacter sp.]|uniref:Alkyl hydroperoxide reductase AhpD n=2 Tax=Acetobacter aceti TaxID=435 RepID=A0A6S6PI74_ACEAC|nr:MULTISPECIES: carboxymuconolactone decarboxylase family protein [Acetobacter]GBO79379.1 peroxiredoxin reductase AhpD [Acetobacter aceti NRIC 0242]TCS35510.1 alkyl hydroperoxide reductase subunit D [Acetobacter aceti NBRC 14818]BCI67023.1 alkyl hydroperoxide reductase AhpD [Acetobacter aceti]BCK75103.1 alkyl hydroperoxide reductase AhpD [Acetobacter aceti NBRC 14818]GAN57056.1 peroxiredoxin reductase AhpD [Acetobacter aceti NBRC 14818]